MIEFHGELSHKCKQYLLRGLNKLARFSAIMVFLIIGAPIAIIGIIAKSWLCGIIATIVGLICLAQAFPKLNPQQRTLNLSIPIKVIINKDKLEKEICADEKFVSRQMDEVKRVVDMGDWYHIFFHFGHKSICFVCQKNLITKGTIEDFEKLFDGKIERK